MTAQAREHDTLIRIGTRIRAARTNRRMTLDDLAKACGLSITFLSRLERGQVACSIGNLLEIAGVLDLAPARLFDDPDDDAPAKPYRVVRATDEKERGRSEADTYVWEKLASGRGEQRIEAFDLKLARNSQGSALVTHPGEEFCFVLEGRVAFQIGDEVLTLDPGDSVHLRSDVPHMAWNTGRTAARLLMVTAIENQSATAVEWWAQRKTTITVAGPRPDKPTLKPKPGAAKLNRSKGEHS
jgi:transcriptional regulator with XRE-family HTH domain